MTEISSPKPWTGSQELKHELLMKAEELERLIAMYKYRLCGDEMVDCPGDGTSLMEHANEDVLGDQRGQFYEVYMRKREVKLREEWRVRGAEKEAEIRARMESLASTFLRTMSKEESAKPKQQTRKDFKELSEVDHHNDAIFSNDHPTRIDQRKLFPSNSSSVSSSSSRSSATAALRPNIRSSSSGSLRKENAKPLTGIRTETAVQRSIGRSNSSKEKMGLIKDMKTKRLQTLHRNSTSLGEPKNFTSLNSYHHVNINPSPKRGEPITSLKNRNVELRISPASGSPTSDEQSNEMLNEGDKDNIKLKFFKKTAARSMLSGVREAYDSVDSPLHVSATESLQDVNQSLEGKTCNRERKKWGSVESLRVNADASGHPLMDVTKGIKRLLKLGKKSREMEVCNDKDEGYSSAKYSLAGFNEDEIFHEQVERPSSTISGHFASLKLREECLFGDSTKGGLFSFPST